MSNTEHTNPVVDRNGVLLADATIGGMTFSKGTTAVQRTEAIARAHGVEVSRHETGPQFHTEQTARHLALGDAQQQVDEKATAALKKAFGALDPKQRETHRHAFEADMRALYAGQPSPGAFKASLDKAARDVALQAALNKAIAEGKSSEEISAIMGSVLGKAPTRRDDSGRFASATPAASPYTPQQWRDGHKSVTDKDGWIPLDRINKEGLSGYTLPRLVANQVYRAEIFENLADARRAGFTQEQVDSFIKAQMTRDGWIKA